MAAVSGGQSVGSPLGRYSDVAATVVGIGVVTAWLVVHAAVIIASIVAGHAPTGIDTTSIDLAATLALGVILGQRATTNGASAIAAATNLRLDAIGAPSAAASALALGSGGLGPVVPTPPATPAVG